MPKANKNTPMTIRPITLNMANFNREVIRLGKLKLFDFLHNDDDMG
jgi:hypothetical protein